MSGQIQYGPVPSATSSATPEGAPADDQGHFATPVRFGRRKTDQVGQLVLTTHWLQFRGTVEMRVGWSDVARVDHAGKDLIVALHGTLRTLVFSCQSIEDATRGSIVATHLTGLAQSEPCQALYTP